MKCKNCGSEKSTWATHIVNPSGVVNGRLMVSDLSIQYVLGCDTCSETLRVTDVDPSLARIRSLIDELAEAKKYGAPQDASILSYAASCKKCKHADYWTTVSGACMACRATQAESELIKEREVTSAARAFCAWWGSDGSKSAAALHRMYDALGINRDDPIALTAIKAAQEVKV